MVDCGQCGAFVVDTLKVDLRPVWVGPLERLRYRQVWRLFPCGHTLVSEEPVSVHLLESEGA